MSDLPRLAEGVAAEEFAGFQKLLRVKIADGWVHGELPNGSDAEHWWSPFEEYYASPEHPPFMGLLDCGAEERDVITFLESFGSIVEGGPGSDGRRTRFSIALFHFERLQFSFLVSLFSNRPNPNECRRLFREYLGCAGQNIQNSAMRLAHGKWKQAIRSIWSATQQAEMPATYIDGRQDWTPVVNSLNTSMSKMKSSDLQRAAHSYIGRTITTRIKGLQLACEAKPTGVRLFAHCDNVLQGFYWMLADYCARRDGRISTCASCHRVFIGQTKYCPDRPECKERGRRRLDWDRNSEKYNRNRRRNRRLARKG